MQPKWIFQGYLLTVRSFPGQGIARAHAHAEIKQYSQIQSIE
jgi:hypothetical protein